MDDFTFEEVDNSCPFCKTFEIIICKEEEKHWVMCVECFACGPVADVSDTAKLNWMNRKTENEENPLGIGAKRVHVFN
jgi:Zn ribbon nucleic-acid-binding protein